MIITSALVLLLTTHSISDSHHEYHKLSKQLADRIEWIDQSGSRTITKRAAQAKLLHLSDNTPDEISKKHFSSWKNGKCYWIFNIASSTGDHRVFFFCRRDRTGQSKVTKIKIT